MTLSITIVIKRTSLETNQRAY